MSRRLTPDEIAAVVSVINGEDGAVAETMRKSARQKVREAQRRIEEDCITRAVRRIDDFCQMPEGNDKATVEDEIYHDVLVDRLWEMCARLDELAIEMPDFMELDVLRAQIARCHHNARFCREEYHVQFFEFMLLQAEDFIDRYGTE